MTKKGECTAKNYLLTMSNILFKYLYKKAREIADEKGIANQTKTVVAGGNDASAIHKSAGGIKTVAVSLPCRYIHSSACVGSKSDMESVKALTIALLEEFANG